ncbi:MAG: preprotein translocase subunit SecE [Actinobacteria bacterium]|nr:preprotein translocase subunit SecE [Actinomycetota bacterium]
MNRQMKRMQERQERQQRASVADRRQQAATSARRAGPSGGREGRKRTGARQFLKEVRQELSKVDWPTRKELGTYTVVVLATVVVLTAFVFALDYGFSKAIVNILGN